MFVDHIIIMGTENVLCITFLDTSTDKFKATVDSSPVSQEEVKKVQVYFLWWILV